MLKKSRKQSNEDEKLQGRDESGRFTSSPEGETIDEADIPYVPYSKETMEEYYRAIDNLLKIQSTLQDVAAHFDCHPNTIVYRLKKDKGKTWQEYRDLKKRKGHVSMRRRLYLKAQTNHILMMFWAENFLGMTRSLNLKHTGEAKVFDTDPSNLTDEQIRRLRAGETFSAVLGVGGTHKLQENANGQDDGSTENEEHDSDGGQEEGVYDDLHREGEGDSGLDNDERKSGASDAEIPAEI